MGHDGSEIAWQFGLTESLDLGTRDATDRFSQDVSDVRAGISAFRLLVSSDTALRRFTLMQVRSMALENGLCVCTARLSSSTHLVGKAKLAFRRKILASLSAPSAPSVNGWEALLHDFTARMVGANFLQQRALRELHANVGGYDFAAALRAYLDCKDAQKQKAVVAWLSAELGTRQSAFRQLGIRALLQENATLDVFKLIAAFAQLAGHLGLLVIIDDVESLCSLPGSYFRWANWELLKGMLKAVLVNQVPGLYIIAAGTAEIATGSNGATSNEDLGWHLAGAISTNAAVRRNYGAALIGLPQLSADACYRLHQYLVFAGTLPAGLLSATARSRGAAPGR